MYAKVFEQIFDSSISEDHVVRHVFMDLLVLANKHGEIDMTMSAISRRTNVPLAVLEHAIKVLCAPDLSSRTADEEGRRLLLMDAHRDWGWRIVNYSHYNAMRNEDSRREYFREYKAKQRAFKKESTLSTVDKVESTMSPRESTVSTNVPVPVPVPVDVDTKKDHLILPEMVSQAVLTELCLSDKWLAIALTEIAKAEMKRGALPGDIRDEMVSSYREYEVAKPKLKYTKGATKFFGEGDWRNKAGWPWAEDKKPAGRRIYANVGPK